MLGKILIAVAITALLIVLSSPINARFNSGCRPFDRQGRIFFGRPYYGARFCGGVYYGACWRWQFTPWGWRLIKVCGGWFGAPDRIRLP
jgi:hypothetical protein